MFKLAIGLLVGALVLAQPSAPALRHQGAFLPPSESIGGYDLAYGGRPLAFNPANRSLFIGTLQNRVTEISIPKEGEKSVYLQPMVDPSEGRLSEITTGSLGLYGLLVDGNRLYFTAAPYYDAQNEQRVSHGARSTTLTKKSFDGWSSVWRPDRSGFVAGWMAWIPPEWRERLGGPAITGNGTLPIISRTSHGPAAFAFNPAAIVGAAHPVSAIPLVYYPIDHPTLGAWENQSSAPNLYFDQSTQIGGLAIVGDRALFFGRQGTSASCYGYGVTDKALHRVPAADGVMQCYDPKHASKGGHAYPYRYQVWAYDLADFAAVKAGKRQPWDLKPEIIPLDFLDGEIGVGIGGVAFDGQQTIYVSVMDAHPSRMPMIHAITVTGEDARVASLEARLAAVEAALHAADERLAKLLAALLAALKP